MGGRNKILIYIFELFYRTYYHQRRGCSYFIRYAMNNKMQFLNVFQLFRLFLVVRVFVNN